MAKVIKAALIAAITVALVVVTFGLAGPAGMALFAGNAALQYAAITFVGSVIAGGIGMLTSRGIEATSQNFGTKITGTGAQVPRQIVYGETRIAGTIVKMRTSGNKNNTLNMGIVLAGHEIESLEGVYIDTDLITTSTSTISGETVYTATNSNLTNTENDNAFTGGRLLRYTFHDGSQTTSDGYAGSITGLGYGTNAKFQGMAYVFMQLVYDPEKLASIPKIWFKVKGKKVYDPRTSATAWSDNPALIARDFLVDTTYGLKCTASEINDTNTVGGFYKAADICDQQVVLANGSSYENRYTANGFTNASATLDGILEGILTACSGSISYTNGKFNLFVGGDQSASLTIRDEDVLAPVSITTKSSGGDLYNAVKALYVSPANNYQGVEAPILSSNAYLGADTPTGESNANYKKTLEIQLPFTTKASEAQRLQKIALIRQRQTATISTVVSLKFMQLQPNDWVYLVNERLSYGEDYNSTGNPKTFEVKSMQMEFFENDGTIFAGTRLILQEIDDTVYDYAAGDYQPEEADSDQPSTGDRSIAVPTIVGDNGLVQRTRVEGPTAKIDIIATWTNDSDEAVQGTELQFKESTDTDYSVVGVSGKASNNAVIPNVSVGKIYDVRIRHFSWDNVYSAFVSYSQITITQPNTISAPTSAAATTDKPFFIELTWTNPANTNLRAVEVHYSATSGFTPDAGTLLNTYYGDVAKSKKVILGISAGLSYDTNYYFKLRSINVYGSASGYTAQVTGQFKKAQNADVENLNASAITAGTIDAGTITVENLNASNFSTGTLSVDRLDGTVILEDDLTDDTTTISGGNILTGNITLSTTSGSGLGSLKAGKTSYEDTSTAGYYLGFVGTGTDAGDAAFSIGNATSGLTYKPTAGLTVTGNLSATTGAIGGFDIGSDYIADAADSMGLSSTVTEGDDVRFWAGETFANRATAPFRVTESGVFTATSAAITGAITATSGTFTGTVNASAGEFTGSVSIGSTGAIYGGTMDEFLKANTSGFFLGYDTDAYKLSVGDASGEVLTWDGSKLNVEANTVSFATGGEQDYSSESRYTTSQKSATVVLANDSSYFLFDNRRQDLAFPDFIVSYYLGPLTSGTQSSQANARNGIMDSIQVELFYADASTGSPSTWTSFRSITADSWYTDTGTNYVFSNFRVKDSGSYVASLDTRNGILDDYPTMSPFGDALDGTSVPVGLVDNDYFINIPISRNTVVFPKGRYFIKVVITVTDGSLSPYPSTGSPTATERRVSIPNASSFLHPDFGQAVFVGGAHTTIFTDNNRDNETLIKGGSVYLMSKEGANADDSDSTAIFFGGRGTTGGTPNSAYGPLHGLYFFNDRDAIGSGSGILGSIGSPQFSMYVPYDGSKLTFGGDANFTDGLYINGVAVNAGAVTGPAGADTQIQYNDGGSLGASANLTFNDSTNTLTVQNLTVSGTTTTVNTDNLTVKDPNITLNFSTGDSSSTANNAGITIQDAVDASTDASILWKTASDTFEFSHKLIAPSADFSGTLRVLTADANESILELRGTSQGTGKLYVGQSATHGGGIEYNGDATPSSSGAGADYTALYRRTVSTDSWTARNFHSSPDWEFRGNLTANSNLYLRSSGGETGIYLQDSSASNATAFKIYADVTLATSTLYIDYDPSVAGNNWAFVNNGNFLASGTIYADGAASNSLQWEAGYDYSQVGHLPLAGGTVSAQTFFLADVAWKVSGSDAAHQRADARDDATSFSRLHWYGVADNGATSNFRHAWYDGAAYINVTAASGTATFGGNIAATDATFTGDVETKIIDQYQEFSAGNGDHEVHYFSKVLATYSENYSSQTYIILTTSVPQSASSMGGFQLTFWDRYNDADSGDVIDIYGYWNPESNDGFQGFRYNSKNPNFEPTIQVGADSNGNVVFIISNFGTSSYAQLVAKDLWLGYVANGVSRSSGQGWSFSTSNSISAYSNLDTLARNGVTSAQITNLNTAYNYSQVGHLPLAGGTLTGTLAMGANAITSTGTISSGAITSTGDLSADDGRVRIGNPTTLSGRSSIRIDANGDSFADLVFGDNTSATGWNDANWSISSRSSSENNSLRIYRGAGQPSPYNSEHVLMEFKQNNLVSVNSTLQINNTTIIDSSRNLTNIGTISSGAITSISAIGAADDVRTGLIHYDSTAMAAGVGGQLVLGYNYLSTGGYTAGAILKTYKENATSNHYGSGLKFQVRNTGFALSTKMTLNPSGNLSVTGGIQSFGPKNQTEYPGGILNITDTTSVAAGVGGGLLFSGKYSGSTVTTSGSIDTRKDNGTAGSFGFSMVFNTRVNGGANTTALTLGSNQSATFAGTVTATQDAYVDNHLHVGKSGGWLQFYDDQGVGNTTSKGNLYFDATTKEFRFYSAVLSTGAAESTSRLKRYTGSTYATVYDTEVGVPWADISAGVRTNFNIGFKPATSNYAGLLFQHENGNHAGYLLVRANSDVAPTYKANGVHLIADAGYLSLVSRTTSNTGVRILSGAVPAERMVFKSDGEIDQPNAIWKRTYHQEHTYASGHTANMVHTHWGVLAAGSHSGAPSTYTIIQTNVSQDAYRMGGFTLLVMDSYGDYTQRERIDLAGYWNPESNGGFQGWGYTTTNPAERPTIQVMRNSSTGKVAFAYSHTSGGSTGSYPVIVACDLWLGYVNAIQDDGRDWSMIGAGNLTGYTNIDTVNYAGGNGNYQATDGRLVISKSAGTILSHGAFSDAIGYNASYGTYIGANGRYVYSGLSTHPVFSDGTNQNNILHNGGQIANTYNGDHTFTTTTTSAGIKVTNNQSGGPALKIHNTSTSGTDWWLISNGTANTNGVGLLQLWANNYSFTSATFGNTATSITNLNTQTRVTATGTPPNFTTTTSGDVTPVLLANSNGQGAHGLVVNQTQTSHWAQMISTQGYGLYIDNHASSSSNDLFKTAVGGNTQFYIRGDGVTFCKQAFYIGDSSVFGTLHLQANSSSGGTIDAYAPNGSYVHSDVRDNGTWSMAHKYTFKNGSGYGQYAENWWDGNSYHQLASISNAIRTNGDFVASGNITAYGTFSDIRLKENIVPFVSAREAIAGINTYKFNYKGKADTLIGVIAQEVEKTLPELTYELIDDDKEVRKAVRYDHLSAVLLQAVKEQDEEIKELKEMVKQLMEKIQ